MRKSVQVLGRLPQSGTVGPAILLMALLIVFFWPAVTRGESLLPVDLIYELDPVWQNHAPAGFTAPGNRLLSDQVYHVYPWKTELRRQFSERRIPLWTSRINSGQPMMGNGQVGVWDPFWLLAYPFPLNDSFLVVAMLRLWVGGMSTYLLARQLGISRRGAILAMVAFAFSGPMMVWLGYPLPSVLAWLPLILYLSDRAMAGQSVPLTIAAGIVLAFQLFGGHPETSFHVALTWAVFCLARAIGRYGWHWRPMSRVLGGMVLAAAIGLSLSAVQLLPLAEGILNSALFKSRQASIPTEASLPLSILLDWRSWPTIITTILPQFFGTPIDNSYWYPYGNYNEQTAYVGIVPLALGLLATFAWWQNRRTAEESLNAPSPTRKAAQAFFIGWTLLALGVALQLPIFSVVKVLPVVRLINHGRMRLIYALGLALLAGFGLDVLSSSVRQRLNAPRITLLTITALAIVSLLCIGLAHASVTTLHDQIIAAARSQVESLKASDHPMYPYSLEYYHDRVNTRYTQMRQLFTLATPQMFVPVGIALAVGMLELIRRRGWSQGMWLNGLVLLTVVDLFIFGVNINPTMDRNQVYPGTETIEFLRQQAGVFRVGGLYLALMPNSSMVFGLSDVRGYDAVVPWRQADLIDHVEGSARVGHYSLLRSANSRLLDLMNVQYLVSDRELDADWELAYEEGETTIRVYRNPHVLPRAFLVYRAEHAANPEAALTRLLDDSFDFETTVILEGTTPDSLPDVPRGSGKTRIVRYEPENVVIDTDTSSEGYVVLTDSYMPGWQAKIDGQPTDLLIANYAFRAIRVPRGQHRVEFIYAPLSFTIGAALSVAAVAACLLWGALYLFRRVR